MKPTVKDAQRVRGPQPLKDRMLKKTRKKKTKPPGAFNGAEKVEPKSRTGGKVFCPKCGSTDVFWASGLPQIWSVWDCRHCGYRGAFVIKDGELAEKLRKEYTRKVPRK